MLTLRRTFVDFPRNRKEGLTVVQFCRPFPTAVQLCGGQAVKKVSHTERNLSGYSHMGTFNIATALLNFKPRVNLGQSGGP